MRTLLLASVTLNLLLVTSLVLARVDRTRASIGDDSVSAIPFTVDVPTRPPSTDAGRLRQALEDGGFAARDIRPMLLGWLEAEYRAAWQYSGPAYWQRGYTPAFVAVSRQHEVASAVRETLVSVFGAEAATDRAFDPVFRPLDPAYAFLSSTEQLALEQARFDRLSAQASSGQPGAAVEPRARCPRADAMPLSAATITPAADLPPLAEAGLAEYLLRFSSVADGLRDADINDETTFRAAFGLVRALGEESDAARQLSLRRRLRELLGDAAFDELWSRTDPRFAALEQYLAARGRAAHEIDAAYSILNRSQEAMLHLFTSAADDAGLITEANAIESEATAALERLLGETDAAGLRSAIVRAEMTLARSLGAAC